MKIEKYVIVDADDNEDDRVFDTLDEAKDNAPTDQPCAIIARIFEYADSELVWTSTGANIWPPRRTRAPRSNVPPVGSRYHGRASLDDE